MKTIATVSLTTLLMAGCVTTMDAPPTPDTNLGLVKESVFDVPTPPVVKTNETAPGEQAPLPRAYTIAPPRVPHAVQDFLPITLKQNACVDCHQVAEKKKGEPTPIPASHYTDYRNAPDRQGTKLVGARHVCTACHVPTTDAPALVGSRFAP